MLEFNNYYIQDQKNLTDLFTNIFVIIDDIYNEIIPITVSNRRNIKDSKLSDSEIITISIVGELLTIDSEKAFFSLLKREYKNLFPKIGDRTRFNRTKRNLYWVISKIREHISLFMQSYSNNIRIVDSMPIPVCEFGRAHFSKCFKGEASYGRCPSKKQTYFGFKFHALTTIDGFLSDYIITPANVDDRNAVWDLCDKYKSISIIGDKGYVNKRLTPELKVEKDINLLFLKRGNSKDNYPKDIRQLIFKARRRIETSFSQLAEQLNLNKVKSKSMLGFITRTSIKVLAHNISFLINKLMGNEDSISKIKRLVFG
ncbi:Transposase IS4 protein [Romboutsia ilealis]|uniref:Transposase IS4 protein n=1 Tax=Romboutsia ilealis TaxID=1115758 RepID=A0A1V1I036_9FIRM|nr:IS982 family transposase [Romboutsia ilealis]CED92971.1 Transposase IS4 protein [Romboutsia ilealis]CED93420.1 Transposase IS4 protein [Romboutsia ilealis]CED93477.1 Transposase IS4 protein [Romboutsia ilealis]CED93689.1 Transposase IS4 protein [Romboutsia ilealis]CED94043.1 Transposase IS4 protein [Romboutsia ilealis]